MIKLYPYQKTAVKFATQHKKAFIEAPTGSGKSIMIGALVEKYAKEGKKVIVSTSTNQLALELLNVLKEKFNLKQVDIAVGKSNYIDIDNINLGEISKIINAQDFIQELSALITNFEINKNEDFLIDVFLEKFDIDEATKNLLIRYLKTENDKDYIKKFPELQISVTNHYYLLYQLLHKKNNFNENYVFILDEVHQISEAMETIFTYNFSLFRFKYLLNDFIEELKKTDFRGKKILLKKSLKTLKKVNLLFNNYTNKKLVGLSFSGKEKHLKIINQLIKHIALNTENIELFQKIQQVKKIPNYKVQKLLIEEWNELREIATVDKKEITLYYSPAKGYPSLSTIKGNIYGKLVSIWKKMHNVKALSATLSVPNDEEYFKKKLAIKENTQYYKMSPVFKKKQIEYLLIDETFPIPNTTEDSVDATWIKSIGDFILSTFEEKNSLILMGGFLEVDALYDYLKSKTNNIPLLKADKNRSTYNIIKDFKEQGGILIGTRNYGIGIDLKGSALEKLYIAKLPYPVLGTKKWLDLMEKSNKMSFLLSKKEMLLNLKQGVGRLIRTDKDKGDLYILDSRLNRRAYIRQDIVSLIKNSFK